MDGKSNGWDAIISGGGLGWEASESIVDDGKEGRSENSFSRPFDLSSFASSSLRRSIRLVRLLLFPGESSESPSIDVSSSIVFNGVAAVLPVGSIRFASNFIFSISCIS
mmetsp:Transcript_18185/g.17993  ORF Transcript_18185/g.17993 Transcript_18185/m.17993 type:complete len:109 (+) Transcript_18185:171-497(+)